MGRSSRFVRMAATPPGPRGPAAAPRRNGTCGGKWRWERQTHELWHDARVAERHWDVEDGAQGVDRPVDVLADERDLAEADAGHGGAGSREFALL